MGKAISFNQSTITMPSSASLPVRKFGQINLTRDEKIRNFAANIFTLFLWSGFHHLKLKYAVHWQKGDKAIESVICAIKAGATINQDDIVSMLKGNKSTEDKLKMWSFYLAQNEFNQNSYENNILSLINKIISPYRYVELDKKVEAVLPQLVDQLLNYHPMESNDGQLIIFSSRRNEHYRVMDHLIGNDMDYILKDEANNIQLTLSQLFFRLLFKQQFEAAKVFINKNISVDQFQTTIRYRKSWKDHPWFIHRDYPFKEHIVLTMLRSPSDTFYAWHYNYDSPYQFPIENIVKFWLDNGLDLNTRSTDGKTLKQELAWRVRPGHWNFGPHNEKILAS